MKTAQEKVADIKFKVKKCVGDRKAANSIIDILCYSQDEEPSVMLAAVRGLQHVFTNFFAHGDMSVTSTSEKDEDLAHGQLCDWLQQQYHTTCDAILDKLESPDVKLREGALVALMKFVEMEAKHPLQKQQSGSSFPERLLQDVVEKLLSATDSQEALITRLSELTEYDDVRFFLMKALKQNLSKKPVKGRAEMYLANVLSMIYNLQLPQGDSDLCANMLTVPEGEEPHTKAASLKAHKKLFTACLMGFLRSDLTPSLYRRVLTKLDDKLLPFLSSPLLLADFLTESYNIGGAISLLALNGLFILIHKYNLDYPDFYTKFYTLFQPQIFQAKYCARFFYLADIFLSSTHLPAYLIAAFIKRLSRLALTAPPAGAKVCIVLVEILLVRHPSCSVLVNRPCHTCSSDPFLDRQEDPAKTCAMDSSLWEIKTLQSHYSPEVAQEAMSINHPIKQEKAIADFLEGSTEQMIERVVHSS
ncbi:nucleolar complex protein 4 homolog isoform X2 [Babylonia areolata]|uniref:nucleolar complex protein 4 homolog isoform X2 n=1 Tax=Babylonia areolata TaxID=304850 RepID=UPI003FD31719